MNIIKSTILMVLYLTLLPLITPLDQQSKSIKEPISKDEFCTYIVGTWQLVQTQVNDNEAPIKEERLIFSNRHVKLVSMSNTQDFKWLFEEDKQIIVLVGLDNHEIRGLWLNTLKKDSLQFDWIGLGGKEKLTWAKQ